MRFRLFVLALLLALVAGCSAPEELKPDQPAGQGQAKADAAPAPKADEATEKEQLEKLAKLEKAQGIARVAYLKSPKDAAARMTFIKATNEMALHLMYVESIPPGQRYPKALKLYREVLEADPGNKEAKEWSDMIVEIYKSMGRPVPKA